MVSCCYLFLAFCLVLSYVGTRCSHISHSFHGTNRILSFILLSCPAVDCLSCYYSYHIICYSIAPCCMRLTCYMAALLL